MKLIDELKRTKSKFSSLAMVPVCVLDKAISELEKADCEKSAQEEKDCKMRVISAMDEYSHEAYVSGYKSGVYNLVLANSYV